MTVKMKVTRAIVKDCANCRYRTITSASCGSCKNKCNWEMIQNEDYTTELRLQELEHRCAEQAIQIQLLYRAISSQWGANSGGKWIREDYKDRFKENMKYV